MSIGLQLDDNPNSRMVFLFKDTYVYRLEIYNNRDEKFFKELLKRGYTYKEAKDYKTTGNYQCITRKSRLL